MTQIRFNIYSGLQNKIIKILQRNNVHAEVLFAFVRTFNGIEPLFIVADDMPKELEKELYKLIDSYLDFQKILDDSKK